MNMPMDELMKKLGITDKREEIRRELANMEQGRHMRVLLAAEAGSRAWGFESDDSDFDVRFIYVRPVDWYLSISPGRDVMEYYSGDLDMVGWDLPKALRLLQKGNPQLMEWLHPDAPLYRANSTFLHQIRQLANDLANPIASIYHYFHMARGNWDKYLQDETLKHKKYLYVLRPILTVRHIEFAPALAHVPPLKIDELLPYLPPDPHLNSEVHALLARKRAGGELASGERLPALHAWLESELERLEKRGGNPVWVNTRGPSRAYSLDELFRETLKRAW